MTILSRFLVPLLISVMAVPMSSQPVSSQPVWSDGVLQVENIRLNSGEGRGPSEPSLAISFQNKDILVAGAILDRVYRSEDGGKTWVTTRLKSPYGVHGDPCVVSDYEGNFYYLHLAYPKGEGRERWLDRIVAHVSKDGGKTWNEGTFMGMHHPKDQDKEWAIVDPANGHVYVTWTEFDRYGRKEPEYESRILFSKSTDRGESWSKAKAINAKNGNCIDGDDTVEGAVPAVGPNGEVYVAWSGFEKIYFDRSEDGGETFLDEDIVASEQPGGWTFDVPGIYRCNGLPITLCDLSQGPHRGTIYINWSDQRRGEDDTDVWVIKSKDQGNTWSDPIRVNDDPEGRHQFFTWMTLDQTTGHLYAVFYDRRRHQGETSDVYLAYSRDGGETFRNIRISDEPFVGNAKVFMGDYTNVAAHDGRIGTIWTRVDGPKTTIVTAVFEEENLLKSIGSH